MSIGQIIRMKMNDVKKLSLAKGCKVKFIDNNPGFSLLLEPKHGHILLYL